MRSDCVRRPCGAILAAFLCGGVRAIVCGQQPSQQNATNLSEAPTVVNVRVVTVSGEVLKVSNNVIAVEAGKPLDRQKVAATLKSLFRTGAYSEIRAVSEPVPGGVQIDFVVQENLFFNQVIVLGLKAPPTEASAAAAMQITLGDAFRKEVLQEAVERLKAGVQEEGLY